jgi:hypothetical protein
MELKLTPAGGLIRKNGDFWEPYDFNKQYAGYYQSCIYTAVAYVNGMYYLAGVDESNKPHLFCSLSGDSWERVSIIMNLPRHECIQLNSKIISIEFDNTREELRLVCDNGQLAILRDCPKCVRIYNSYNSSGKETEKE